MSFYTEPKHYEKTALSDLQGAWTILRDTVVENFGFRGSDKILFKNWARLIQKIYNVNPLLCPKCLGSMKIIYFIEDEEIISKILKHLGLWEVKQRPPPRANAPNIHIDYTDSQIPSYEDDLYCDPDYPIEIYAS
jgi:hypothetical protein